HARQPRILAFEKTRAADLLGQGIHAQRRNSSRRFLWPRPRRLLHLGVRASLRRQSSRSQLLLPDAVPKARAHHGLERGSGENRGVLLQSRLSRAFPSVALRQALLPRAIPSSATQPWLDE